MTGVRGIVIGLIGAVLILAMTACGPATTLAAGNQPALVSTPAPTQTTAAVVWGKVPYCNCLATSATVNVADALKQAKLAVTLKELSPREGWLYFAVTFDPATATAEQVATAMQAGGAELLAGPP